jgi:hypothetical protein
VLVRFLAVQFTIQVEVVVERLVIMVLVAQVVEVKVMEILEQIIQVAEELQVWAVLLEEAAVLEL